MPRTLAAVLILAVAFVSVSSTAHAAEISDAHYKKARKSIAQGLDFLRATQNEDGSWSPKAGPAITGMIVAVFLDQPNIDRDDPTVAKAVNYILSKVKDDGSIHDGILHNYNTSISLSALSRISGDPKIDKVVENGRAYLKKIQYAGGLDEHGESIDKDHPFWGGSGYGKHGRPDGSNTQFAVQAFIDTGSKCDDPEILRAVDFFSRLQGSEVNKKYGDKIQPDGGAIYATSENKDKVGVPQSQAGTITINGREYLRTYGSMTYAMLKTYLLAKLDQPEFGTEADKQRLKDAIKWIESNWTLEHNPGMPEERKYQGHYYYFATMARALRELQRPVLTTPDGKKHNWAEEVIDKLASLQRKDGSWLNTADRWLEDDPNLVTSYALTALTAATK